MEGTIIKVSFFFNNIFFIFRNPTAFDNMNLTRSFDGWRKKAWLLP